MAEYELSWITDNLALGHAPMSYAELDSIKKQGVGAIINLCAEFCDLHEIEETSGFEVYYLPVCDEEAPREPELEEALDWLDEAIYLGKKVLVHCRYGMGRTATFVAAYLLRKGFGLKLAKKKVAKARSMHSSFSQWRLLRKYSKKSGRLTIREPSLENRRIVDLSGFFNDYEALLARVDELFREAVEKNHGLLSCGSETDGCCYNDVELSFVEAAYLSHHMNKVLPGEERKRAIDRAVQVVKAMREIRKSLKAGTSQKVDEKVRFKDAYQESRILCPLNIDSKCEMYLYRPIACRIYGIGRELLNRPADVAVQRLGSDALKAQTVYEQLRSARQKISTDMLYALTSLFPEGNGLTFTLPDAVSGRFIQQYFEFLSRAQNSSFAPQ